MCIDSASYNHSDEDSTPEESFCLQLKIKWRQAKENKDAKGNTPNHQLGIQITTPSP